MPTRRTRQSVSKTFQERRSQLVTLGCHVQRSVLKRLRTTVPRGASFQKNLQPAHLRPPCAFASARTRRSCQTGKASTSKRVRLLLCIAMCNLVDDDGENSSSHWHGNAFTSVPTGSGAVRQRAEPAAIGLSGTGSFGRVPSVKWRNRPSTQPNRRRRCVVVQSVERQRPRTCGLRTSLPFQSRSAPIPATTTA